MIKIIGSINIELPYYSINGYLKDLVFRYISNDEEKQKDFEEFSRKYTVFSPYFDYAMSHCGIMIENPFFMGDKCLLLRGNHYYIEEKDTYENLQNKKLYYYDMVTCDDKMIGLNKESDYSDGCIIDSDGNRFELAMTSRHLHISHAILNQRLISSVKDYNKYEKYVEKYGKHYVIDFLVYNLGYMYVKYSSSTSMYNPELVTNKQLIVFKSLQKTKGIRKVEKVLRR